jgi:hypothetical protein
MKVNWGSGDTAPRILDLGTRWRWVVSFTPRLLYPQGKSPWQQPLDRRLGGPQSRSGRGGEEKNSQPLPGLKPLIIQPAAQRCTTELSRLVIHVQQRLYSHPIFLSSILIFPSTPRSSEWSPPYRFPNQNFVCISHFSHSWATQPSSAGWTWILKLLNPVWHWHGI